MRQQMQVRQIMMTPEHAEMILAKNYGNRLFRSNWANELAKMIENGEWNLTHQAIAIAANGRLLDGQHRLTAIVKAQQPVPVLLAENCDPASFISIDKGIKRSTADSLGIHKKIVETIAFLLRIAGARAERPQLVNDLLDTEYGEATKLLMTTCMTTRRGASNSAIKAGAVVQMVQSGKHDLIAKNYKKFITLEYSSMPPLLLNLEKQIASGTAHSAERDWLFCRAYKAFSTAPSYGNGIRITDHIKQDILDYVRNDICRLVNI